MYGIIYKATGPSGLVYIGQTVKPLKKRIAGHICRAKKGDRRGAFQIALLEYGLSAFTWEQIDTAEDKAELDAKEKYWIAHYQSDNPAHGYNGTDGGTKTIYSPETRRKISESQKGKTISEEQRQKQREAMKGRHLTEETRRKLSEALKGRKKPPRSVEHRHKLSIARKGLRLSPETRGKMSEARKGHAITEVTRRKMSEAKKGCIPWNKGKRKKQ